MRKYRVFYEMWSSEALRTLGKLKGCITLACPGMEVGATSVGLRLLHRGLECFGDLLPLCLENAGRRKQAMSASLVSLRGSVDTATVACAKALGSESAEQAET